MAGIDNLTGYPTATGRSSLAERDSSAGQAAIRVTSRQIWKRSFIVAR
jgi:hypothetical protein